MTEIPRCILALDPANRTGWAHVDQQGRRTWGVWDLAHRADKHPGYRLRLFYDFLGLFLAERPASLIACEDAHFGTRNHETAAMHAELRGIIKLVAVQTGADYVAYKPNTIKKFATGYGHAKKPQMMAACKRLLEIDPEDDNVADALFILELARQERPNR